MYQQLVLSEQRVRELRPSMIVLKGLVLTKELLEEIACELSRDLVRRKTSILTSFAGIIGQILDDRLLLKITYQLAWNDKDLTVGRPAAMVTSPDQVDKAVVRILNKIPYRDGSIFTVIGASGPLAGTPFKLFVPDQRFRWFQRAVGFSNRGTYRMVAVDSHIGLYVAISWIRRIPVGWTSGFDLNSHLMRRNRQILNARRVVCAMPKAPEGLRCAKCPRTMKECDYALRWSVSHQASHDPRTLAPGSQATSHRDGPTDIRGISTVHSGRSNPSMPAYPSH